MTTLSRRLRLLTGLCALGLAPTVPLAEEGGDDFWLGFPDTPPQAESTAAPQAPQPESTAAPRAPQAQGAAPPQSKIAAPDTAADSDAPRPPAFTDSSGLPSAAAMALLDALAAAPGHALPARRYDAEKLARMAEGLARGGTRDEIAAFETAMTEALLAYGRDVSSGALEATEVARDIKVKPPRPEPDALIAGIAEAADPAAWLAALAPAGKEYARLREAYAGMRDVVASGAWGAPVPEGRTLRQGDSGPRVEALRARLAALGDLRRGPEAEQGAVMALNTVASDAAQPVALSDPWIFDEGLVEAVKRFQARHGLNTDGVVGPATLAALNTSAEERLGQIVANLERLRWLNRDLGERHVMVNIAGFTMTLVEHGHETFTSRVVVGQKTDQTPEFSDVMEHMVVNPSWNVPWSIATQEILPKLRQDPSYLARNNMELVGGPNPWFVDWWRVTPSSFPGRVRQRPGADNALGRVKFMFPNDNAVYLHDTPSRSLFAKDMRAFSHGCIRVEKPLEFAHILLSGQESDPVAAFERLQRSGRETWVQLDDHLPVHIGYRTAWIDANGTPQFRSDIYGRDRLVVAALEKAGLELPD